MQENSECEMVKSIFLKWNCQNVRNGNPIDMDLHKMKKEIQLLRRSVKREAFLQVTNNKQIRLSKQFFVQMFLMVVSCTNTLLNAKQLNKLSNLSIFQSISDRDMLLSNCVGKYTMSTRSFTSHFLASCLTEADCCKVQQREYTLPLCITKTIRKKLHF